MTVLIIHKTAGSDSSNKSDKSSESRSTPSVNCVRSLEPIEKPSKRFANSSARITFDGISRFHLNSGETFTIKKSERKFRLVDISCHDYFSTLREKLNWSGKLR